MVFYDAKGYLRNEGESYYDGKGYLRSPGESFYDAEGYFRNFGDSFYDSRGNLVSPGETFYDGKGYIRDYHVVNPDALYLARQDITAFIAYILSFPIIMLWGMTIAFIEWIRCHLYVVFAGYSIIALIACLIITGAKKHRGFHYLLSFLGNFVCLQSLVYILIINEIPGIIKREESFGSFLEFTICMAFMCGVIAIVQFLNYYHEKAVLEFILGTGFFIVVILMLRKNSNWVNSIEELAQIYEVSLSVFFKLLFEFAV
jgi:hypothetical protein